MANLYFVHVYSLEVGSTTPIKAISCVSTERIIYGNAEIGRLGTVELEQELEPTAHQADSWLVRKPKPVDKTIS